MRDKGFGEGMTNEYSSGLSVDDILAEFQLDQSEADGGRAAYETESAAPSGIAGYAPADPPADAAPYDDAPEEDVRVYRPRSALSLMEEDARQTAARLAEQGYDEPQEEAAYEETRPAGDAEDAGAYDTDYDSAYDNGDYEDYDTEPAPRRGRKGLGGLFSRLNLGGRKEKKRRRGRDDLYEEDEAPEEFPDEPEEPSAPSYEPEASSVPEQTAPQWEDSREDTYSWLNTYVRDSTEPAYTGYTAPSVDDLYDLSTDFSYENAQEEPAPQEEPEPAYEPVFDERFNLDGGFRSAMVFDGQELDLSADENYRPTEQNASALPSYREEPEEAPRSREGKKRRLPRRGRKSGKEERPLNAPSVSQEADFAAGFADYSASPGEYAPAGEYDLGAEDEEELKEISFPSFREYLVSLVSNFLLRLRGFAGSESTATMVDSSEDLGAEVSPAAGSKYYGAFVHSLRLRFRISLVLLLIMCYISLGLPVLGMLKSVHVAAAMCLALQLTILLLSLDVVTGAVMNLVRRRLGADVMAVLACLLTSVDAAAVAGDLFGSLHMPLCALSSLSLCGVLLSSLLSARGLRKALRVPAIGKRTYAVSGETGLKGRGKDITLLKSVRPVRGFVRRAEEMPPDESLFIRLSPLLLLAALLLGLIAAIATKNTGDLLYIVTAVLVPAVPVSALLSFALPFCVGSMRIFSSGAAIAGWSGLCDIGQSRNLIVTDRDLFPEGSVELESIRIFADESSDKVIAYAGTMIIASGSCLSNCFAGLMEKNGCSLCQVENFEILPGGGMRGVIDGENVLCGSSDLMRLMNVRIPFRLVDRTTVLLAIDGVLYGIFNMNYTPEPQVRKALVGLMRSNRHPVFAVRDFNITPEMLHRSFDIATDGYDFPPYVERFSLSEDTSSRESKIAAVVCREGLGPLTHMADTGRSMYVAVRINLLLSLLSVAIGMLTVFIKLLGGGVGVGFLLAYMLVWVLPPALLSLFLRF